MVAVAGLWWSYPGSATVADKVALAEKPQLTSDRPEIPPAGPIRTDVAEKGADPDPVSQGPQPETAKERAERLVAAGKDALGQGDLIAARSHFSDAVQTGVDEPQASIVVGELNRLGSETVFSPRVFEGDAFAEQYVIKTGDSLAKIANANKVSADLLAQINGIQDKNLIRAGQSIKLVKGPFHAVVDKGDFTLELFLGKTMVKHFRVGLGADNSTPTGTWQVENKLANPTYYPPRGGDIIAADDPNNPLGERWIGLTGISGQAVGQQRYGIHGTNEPDSIGRNVSMGCIRMYNEDVEQVYIYLVEKHSTVIVKD
jgi:lipoprotein-anchoring transpeptidase ErfK/SrfK